MGIEQSHALVLLPQASDLVRNGAVIEAVGEAVLPGLDRPAR